MGDLGVDPRPARGAVREVFGVDRVAELDYSPELDGAADPGEIVWAWVPYEEDPDRGKDRPLLVVGRAGGGLLGVMLSSHGDHGPEWLELGVWGRDDKVSYVRLDRVFLLSEEGIRREGAVLDAGRFARVAAALHELHGWRVA